ncbi:MAG: hypothetical protein AAFR11_04205 [Pseudomonadota bacterium]
MLTAIAAATLAASQVVPVPDPYPFPETTASNLSRERFTVPDDLPGDARVLLLAYEQEHQFDIDTWLAALEKMSADRPGLAYYELPTVQGYGPIFSRWLDGVMRDGIPDADQRARTITLYVNKRKYLKALRVEDAATIDVMLIDKAGDVVWRARGAVSPETRDALQTAVDDMLGAA